MASNNQREYNRRQGIFSPNFELPVAEETSSPSGALHDFDKGYTRLSVTLGPHRQRVLSGDPSQLRLISRRIHGQLTFKPPPLLDSFQFFSGV